MTQIMDVSPIKSNTNATDINHSVIGRMLSIACSPDGETVYAGSYSNLWTSDDGGKSFAQLTWPQPAPGEFDVPGALGGWCVVDIAVAGGWRVDRHPRFMARLTRRGHMDIVGFGDCGVWTALGNGDGSFQAPNVVINNFGYNAGGWQIDKHPRFVVDLNGDGCADIVGFGDAGVWTALGNGDGTFQAPQFVLGNYGYNQDWRVDKHPRFLAVLTSSGFPDIVGFGEDGVWVALGNGDGTFREPNPNPVLANFGYKQNWRVDKNPRLLAPLTSSGFADIIGFGTDGVFVVLSNGDGTFREPHPNPVLANFCYKQGWRVDQHPRLLTPLTSSGFSDIVGFGPHGIWTAIGNGDGTFQNAKFVLENFGVDQGWQVDKHPRFVVDINGNGFPDIVGFGDLGVWTALGNGDGSFQNAIFALENFGVDQGWQVDRHPRFAVDLAGTGYADIVGFGDAGVWTAMNDGSGAFPSSNYVLASFGYMGTVLVLTADDRISGSHGIWRSTDRGSTWVQAHTFPPDDTAGQLEWALGSDHLVYAAGGSSLAISKNAGLTFQDVFPWGTGPAKRVNHVAVWQNAPADSSPTVIYALGEIATVNFAGNPVNYGTMFVSFDGGVTWIEDQATSNDSFPQNVGGATSPVANSNSAHVMVISPLSPLQVIITQDGSGSAMQPALWLGDYTKFQTQQFSDWSEIGLATGSQDSGNVFLVVTQPGRGNLLFYGSQTSVAYVVSVPILVPAPPPPPFPGALEWSFAWVALDSNVHFDLHGICLSPDFHASMSGASTFPGPGTYHPGGGTVWLLSDGGIYWSTDGGQSFHASENARTLSCVNIAGVAIPGKSPALSLNAGDNDGFYSMDGGAHWSYQQYGGGDNDCSFSDPLQSTSMLVFTPRWDTAANSVAASKGQTVSLYQASPGNLPDARQGTNQRRAVTGPPLPPSTTWNASSFFGSRGSRPVVLGLPGEVAPAQGDYIFVLNPATQPVLVRTQNIIDIKHRVEWLTTATGPGQGANVYLQGPTIPTPQPGSGFGVVQASGGHNSTVFYLGGDGTLWTWTAGATSWNQLAPAPAVAIKSAGVFDVIRFFVHPYQPNVIYILDIDHVKRSDDGGNTWQVDSNLEQQLTWGGQIALSSNDDSSGIGDHFDLVLTDMQFDPNNPQLRFAVGEGGAFLTIDGVNWMQLLHTGAMAGRPANCYFDSISTPSDPALYVSFAGRSVVKISDLPLSVLV
ncbi:MAG: VCBS repeat-containing protein [Acidobacteriaceae bacterium]